MARTCLELIRLSAGYLRERGVDAPRLDAELLLAHVLGCGRVGLYTRLDEPLDQQHVARYRELVRARGARTPCAYLTGQKEFYSYALSVDRSVLIPRPETETLVDVVLDAVRGGALPAAPGLDLGTGSGAVAVALGKLLPEAWIVATDCSVPALQVARRNVESHGLAQRVRLATCRGFDGLRGRFAWIASNPPYIGSRERETLMPEVVDYEPEQALFAGEDGLAVLREIFAAAPEHLAPGGLLAVECDPRQAGELRRLGSAFGEVQVVADLAGRERVVRVVRR